VVVFQLTQKIDSVDDFCVVRRRVLTSDGSVLPRRGPDSGDCQLSMKLASTTRWCQLPRHI